MRYTGVLFELFGTLIPPFRMREPRAVLQECAEILGLNFAECYHHWGETYRQRTRGEFASVAENFRWGAQQTGRHLPSQALAHAEAVYARFTAESLVPVADAIETLEWLTAAGRRIGLVSNCAVDMPHVWSTSVFAKYFAYCAFSCHVGAVKPDPVSYRAALDALRLHAEQTLYVGDGSDEELSGAARCGLRPVLIAIDLSNTYDAQRTDVDTWRGPVIRTLSELSGLVQDIERA
jgi:putative hydrolase of the HAD superfamily